MRKICNGTGKRNRKILDCTAAYINFYLSKIFQEQLSFSLTKLVNDNRFEVFRALVKGQKEESIADRKAFILLSRMCEQNGHR